MQAIMHDMSDKETGPRILMRMERKNLISRVDSPSFDVILGMTRGPPSISYRALSPPIVHLEHYSGAASLKGSRDIAAYKRAVNTLRERAVYTVESLRMISKGAAELEGIDE